MGVSVEPVTVQSWGEGVLCLGQHLAPQRRCETAYEIARWMPADESEDDQIRVIGCDGLGGADSGVGALYPIGLACPGATCLP